MWKSSRYVAVKKGRVRMYVAVSLIFFVSVSGVSQGSVFLTCFSTASELAL